jgi:DNA-directed RNA polymerase specialized sigma24 family protein
MRSGIDPHDCRLETTMATPIAQTIESTNVHRMPAPSGGDWNVAYDQLFVYALRCMSGDRATAEEIRDQAIERLLKSARYAQMTDPVERARYRYGAVAFCAKDYWRKRARRGEQLHAPDDPAIAEHAAPTPSPEAIVTLTDLLVEFAQHLDSALADDYYALRAMELHVKGTEEPEEQAAVLCVPLSEIKNAWRRVRYTAGKVRASLGLATVPLFAGAQPDARSMVSAPTSDADAIREAKEDILQLLTMARPDLPPE